MNNFNQEILQMDFKFTTSRGKNTYGYNICTLWVDDTKVGTCTGGGYDMKGTSFSQWLETKYQDRLLALFKSDIESINDSDYIQYKNEKKVLRKECNSFYGAIIVREKDTFKIVLDGACGFSSMDNIARAIGINLKWNARSNSLKNNDLYTAIINKDWKFNPLKN